MWERRPHRGLGIIRPHESLSSLLLVRALTVTHQAMTVTSAQRASRRQGPTTSNEAVRGPCLWTVATNTSWSSPTAQEQTPTAVLPATASAEKRCSVRTSFPSPLHPSQLPPPSLVSPPLCQVVLVLTSRLLTHKGLLKWVLWVHVKERLVLLEVRKCSGCEQHNTVLLSIWTRVTLDFNVFGWWL